MRQFVPASRSGKIVNTVSLPSSEGGMTVPSYAASAAGIANLTRALTNEWTPLDINVNAAASSYFSTELTSALLETEDFKGAVVFLASDAADYVHGTVLPVDGAWLGR